MTDHEVIVVLNSSRFGQGNPHLGEKLMSAFLASLNASSNKPTSILLFNTAIVLSTTQSPVWEELDKLAQAEVDILVNEESMEFYALNSIQKVGRLVSMEEMSEKMLNASLIVKP